MVLFFLIPTISQAQVSVDPAIEESVLSFFEAMREGDSTALTDILAEDCIMKTVGEEEGRVEVESGDRSRFLEAVMKMQGRIEERVSNIEVQQDGPLASVWMEYEFVFEGVPHHCGVNMMTMVLREERWQIIYVIDTRRDCI